MDRQTAEKKVFGEAFTFAKGYAGEEAKAGYIEHVSAAMSEGQPLVWIARNFDADFGICADLWFRGVPTLSLVHDFETRTSDVYTSPVRGLDDGSCVIEDVPFEEAVEAAEAYVRPRLENLSQANININTR